MFNYYLEGLQTLNAATADTFCWLSLLQ